MPSASSRPSTRSLSNCWSECRTTYGRPPNVPSVLRACRSKSWVHSKEWVNLGLEQLKKRSTAGTLLMRERPFRLRSQQFQEWGSREFHRGSLISDRRGEDEIRTDESSRHRQQRVDWFGGGRPFRPARA